MEINRISTTDGASKELINEKKAAINQMLIQRHGKVIPDALVKKWIDQFESPVARAQIIYYMIGYSDEQGQTIGFRPGDEQMIEDLLTLQERNLNVERAIAYGEIFNVSPERLSKIQDAVTRYSSEYDDAAKEREQMSIDRGNRLSKFLTESESECTLETALSLERDGAYDLALTSFRQISSDETIGNDSAFKERFPLGTVNLLDYLAWSRGRNAALSDFLETELLQEAASSQKRTEIARGHSGYETILVLDVDPVLALRLAEASEYALAMIVEREGVSSEVQLAADYRKRIIEGVRVNVQKLINDERSS